MPEGIIRDPKQNPAEKQFGVLYSPEAGYIAYDKDPVDDRRYITTGTFVTFEKVKLMHTSKVLFWDGKVIDYEVEDMTIDPNNKTGPIVLALNAKAKELLHGKKKGWL